MSFKQYLSEIFTDYGVDFAKILCENKLSIESERRLCFELTDSVGNKKELEISLRDLE